MRDVFPRIFWDLLGVAAALGGCLLLGWSGIAYFNPEWGFESASLALSYVDRERPGSWARAAMPPDTLMYLAVAGVALLVIGSKGLADLVGDKDSRDIEFAAPARVGGTVSGRLWLNKRFRPGTQFSLQLRCRGIKFGSGESETVTVFAETITRESADAGDGSFLPFAFNVPAIAPPSDFNWRWQLVSFRNIWTSTEYALTLAPPSEGQLRAVEDARPPGVREEIEEIGRRLGTFGAKIMPHDRARIAAMSPRDRVQMRKGVDFASGIVKVFLVIGALIFLAALVDSAIETFRPR